VSLERLETSPVKTPGSLQHRILKALVLFRSSPFRSSEIPQHQNSLKTFVKIRFVVVRSVSVVLDNWNFRTGIGKLQRRL
jgi:hypothetical protein